MRLILDNYHDRAAMTATSQAPECEIENTQRNEREYVWRSDGTVEQVIEVTLDQPRHIGAVILAGHNLSSSGRVRLELLNSLGDVIHDTGELATAEYIPAGIWRAGIDPYGATYNDQIGNPMTLIDTPLLAAGGYRLTISDERNPAGAIQIWRIISGLWFESTYGPSWGIELTRATTDTRERTAGGSARIIGPGNIWRELTLQLDFLRPSERTKLVIEMGQRGIGANVFLDCYPRRSGVERLDAAFLAQLDSPYGDKHNRLRNYQTTLKFVEV